MPTIILSLFSSARQAFQSRTALRAEILVLRHELLVLQRSRRRHRLRLSPADRFLSMAMARTILEQLAGQRWHIATFGSISHVGRS
jgi:hypothetical protein